MNTNKMNGNEHNKLRHFTQTMLNSMQCSELYRLIVHNNIVSKTQRQRDFSGAYNVPEIRKEFYLKLIREFLPDTTNQELFPNVKKPIILLKRKTIAN